MTITTPFYQPVTMAYDPAVDDYDFQLETVGPLAFELWYVFADDSRQLAPPDHYTVRFSGVSPIYNRGTVTVNHVKVPDNTVTFSIERNTPITQTLDFNTFRAFPMIDIEFTLDKHMMICQELNYRKCDADTTGLEMTQLIEFRPYTPLRANEVTFSVQKLIDILFAIADTAESCADRPEDT